MARDPTDVLLTGRRVGDYRLCELIGSGGMGDVYRATDSRLRRDVAIKILPREFSADPDRVARFEHEARVLATFNHPNIATIHGIEEAVLTDAAAPERRLRALVMELVDGETLAERLCRGPLPVHQAVTIAQQIVDALDAAHEHGIVHRDLKPANVKVTSRGTAKLLDFGLAKAVGLASDALPHSTADAVATSAGTILGTAGYMSPEQARGGAVDKRTDIWAFGCVLYEMLTGRPAFARDTVFDTLAAILERDPDWSQLPAATPPGVTRLLRRCLRKDPLRRQRDVGDARFDLEDALAESAAAASRGAGVALQADIQFQRLTDFPGVKESPALSPDGKMVVFVAMVGGTRQICLRLIAGGTSLQLTHDEVDHEMPRWAPDSSTLIYYTPAAVRGDEGTIWEIGALGGPPRRLVSAIGGGDLSHDGRRIAVFQAAGDGLTLTIMTRDGSPADRMPLSRGFTYASPRWSPDDRSIAFLRSSGKTWDVYLDVMTLVDRRCQQIARGAWLKGLCWVPDGSRLIYGSARRSTVRYPLTFNLRTVGRDGQSDRQATFGDDSYVEPDSRRAGALVAARIRSRSDIWKFPVTGSPSENTRDAVRVTRQTGQVQTPSVSPDEREIVYLSDSGGHGNLWVARTDGSQVRQLTFEDDPDVGIGLPLWSPSGREIVFVANHGGRSGLWTIRPDGSQIRQVVSEAILPAWSPDGRWLYYLSTADGAERIEKVSAEGGSPIVVRGDPGDEGPQISADGSTLYYSTAVRSEIFGFWGADREIRRARPENGPSQVIGYVPGGRVPVAAGAHQIVLSPDGRSLAMTLLDGATTNVWALPTAGGPMTPLTDFSDRSILIARHVSWSPDSQHVYAAVAETDTDIVLFRGLDPC